MDRGGGRTTLWMYLMPLNYTHTMVKCFYELWKVSSFCSIPCQGCRQLGSVFRLLPRVCKEVHGHYVSWPPADWDLWPWEGAFTISFRLACIGIVHTLCSLKCVLIFFQVQSNACPFFCLTFWASEFCWGMCLPSLLPEKHFKMNKTWTCFQPSAFAAGSHQFMACLLFSSTLDRTNGFALMLTFTPVELRLTGCKSVPSHQGLI